MTQRFAGQAMARFRGGPVSDEDLLLLLRGGWLAGEGDLASPAYRARLQDATEAGIETDRILSEGWTYEDNVRGVDPDDAAQLAAELAAGWDPYG